MLWGGQGSCARCPSKAAACFLLSLLRKDQFSSCSISSSDGPQCSDYKLASSFSSGGKRKNAGAQQRENCAWSCRDFSVSLAKVGCVKGSRSLPLLEESWGSLDTHTGTCSFPSPLSKQMMGREPVQEHPCHGAGRKTEPSAPCDSPTCQTKALTRPSVLFSRRGEN